MSEGSLQNRQQMFLQVFIVAQLCFFPRLLHIFFYFFFSLLDLINFCPSPPFQVFNDFNEIVHIFEVIEEIHPVDKAFGVFESWSKAGEDLTFFFGVGEIDLMGEVIVGVDYYSF